MKLLYHGPFFPGSTALHRMESFAAQNGLDVIAQDVRPARAAGRSLLARICWRARWPLDLANENADLLQTARRELPDVVFVDNSKVIARGTLAELRKIGVRILVYYSPDDIIASHNISWPLRLSFPLWDIFFTTKSFNIPELVARGVRQPRLVGNAYSPRDHRPFTPEEVGPDFERFDLVFIGTYEYSRSKSILRLAQAGMSVVVYGNNAGSFAKWNDIEHSNITLRPAVYASEYSRCLHHGKVALCFLRKANRDRITTRSIEIAAAARPMLAERTDEHDEHFTNGQEYVGFIDDAELVSLARKLLADADYRAALGAAARRRCQESGYDNDCRTTEMLREIRRAPASRLQQAGLNND